MSIEDEISDILLEAESDFPAKVTLAGVDYDALVSSYKRNRVLADGGFALDMDMIVTIRAELLSAAPAEQATLTHDGQSFRVAEVTKIPGGSHYRLGCVSASRGT